MARSPKDATRFTSTGPFASASPSFSANAPTTQIQIPLDASSPPPNETPAQKINRLRAAAAASRAAHAGAEPTFDRVVRIGRGVADRAHRATAYGLIGLTVVSAMVATAGISDMLLHNRRRRNEFLAEQRAKSARELAEAVKAIERGEASGEQMLLVDRERVARAVDEERRNRPGVFRRTTGWLFGGLSKEEEKGGRLGAEARGQSSISGAKEEFLGETENRSVLQAVTEKVEERRRTGERAVEALRPAGGPLDQQAALVSDAVVQSGKSWTGWITGR